MQGANHERKHISRDSHGLLWGLVLIVAGLIFLLQNLGFFVNIGAWIAMVLFATGGAVFLLAFLTNLHERWWAAIPGATLLGLASTIFFDSYAPRFLDGFGGPVFLASIGFGFVLVFLADVRKWWAIIPAGVLTTLGVVAGFDELNLRGVDSGGIFFLGLGCTFLLLFVFSGQRGKRQSWALIPAAVMIVMGVLIGTPWIRYMDNLWPLVLIGVGAFWVLRTLGSPKIAHRTDTPIESSHFQSERGINSQDGDGAERKESVQQVDERGQVLPDR